MELMRLISMYATLHILMMCCFTERPLLKMKARLWTVPENSTLVLLKEIVCGCGKVMLIRGGGGETSSFSLIIIQFAVKNVNHDSSAKRICCVLSIVFL